MSRRALAIAIAALAFTGCNSARKLESSSTIATCTRCHGDPASGTGAPPRDLHGDDRTTSISVGAHASHLTGSHGIAGPVPCESCHVVPGPSAVGHPDGRVEVTFGALARAGGATPSWSRTDATCSVYCHGATLRGGGAPPVWTQVDGTQLACDRCHGNPPARPHPQRSDCRACHPATVKEDGAIDVAGGSHVDGRIERELHGCTDCHGDATRAGDEPLLQAAPPWGTNGEQDPAQRAVGAHQVHLAPGARADGLPRIAKPIACRECHAVPASPDHADGIPQVAFGPLASRGDAGAAWDRGALTCAATYCHGATLPGGLASEPVWTQVDGAQRRCDSCHGAPPPPPHPPSSACATCHPGTVREDGSIIVENGLHLNGGVDANRYHPDGWSDPASHGRAANAGLPECKVCHGPDLAGGAVRISCDACHPAGWRTTCTFCHGDPNRATNAAAPPSGTQGETSPGTPAVGAHAAHLQGGPLRSAVECSECHPVPGELSHVDGTRALAFGPLAAAQGATPRLGGDGRCSATYCHGATLAAGGTNTAPAWTGGGREAECGTCHGAPPPEPHVQLTACELCHAATVTSPTTIDVAGGKHVDGLVEATPYHPAGWKNATVHGAAAKTSLASCKGCHGEALDGGSALVSCDRCHQGWKDDCAFCHGDRKRGATAAAPPRGTRGELATTARAVGAHESHLAGGALGTPVACGACHAVPADLSHLDGVPAVAFGALAAGTRWDGARCSASYCHGATLAGGTNTAPQWTKVDGTQAACGTCHGRPPVTGPDVAGYPAHRFHTYRKNLGCETCHDGYSPFSVAPATHLDGVRDVRVRHLECVPAGCAPELDPVCACTEQVATIVGWDCGGCHSKFTF